MNTPSAALRRQVQFMSDDDFKAFMLANLGNEGAGRVNSAAYEASRVLKASPGTLISLIGYNSGPAQWIQLFDSAAVPANGAAPALSIKVDAASNFSVDVPISGIPFTTGISVSNSSTGPTKTIGAGDVYFMAVVK